MQKHRFRLILQMMSGYDISAVCLFTQNGIPEIAGRFFYALSGALHPLQNINIADSAGNPPLIRKSRQPRGLLIGLRPQAMMHINRA